LWIYDCFTSGNAENDEEFLVFSLPTKVSLALDTCLKIFSAVEGLSKCTAPVTYRYLLRPKCPSPQVKQQQHHRNIPACDPLPTHRVRRESVNENALVQRRAL